MDEQQLEREDLIAGLDVLAGLMACFAAMDERARDYDAEPSLTFRRWDRVSAHWIAA